MSFTYLSRDLWKLEWFLKCFWIDHKIAQLFAILCSDFRDPHSVQPNLSHPAYFLKHLWKVKNFKHNWKKNNFVRFHSCNSPCSIIFSLKFPPQNHLSHSIYFNSSEQLQEEKIKSHTKRTKWINWNIANAEWQQVFRLDRAPKSVTLKQTAVRKKRK